MADRPAQRDVGSGPVFAVKKIEPVLVHVSPDGSRTSTPITDPGFTGIIADDISKQHGQFTVASLQNLALRLSAYLREKGNLLASVFVPAQDVRNGTVRFEALMGRLGEIDVKGNTSYSRSMITRAFGNEVGGVVKRSRIESAMLLLDDYPGLSVGGTFYPGKRLGYTRLQLTVHSERKFETTLLADNYGSRYTGKVRGGVHLVWNNPLHLADKAIVDLVAVQQPSSLRTGDRLQDRLYGSLRYEAGPWSPRWSLGFDVSHNNFSVGNVGADQFSQLQITGVAQQARVFFHEKYRSINTRMDNEVGLGVQRAKRYTRDVLSAVDDLTTIDISTRYQHNDGWLGGGVSYATLTYVQGMAGILGSMGSGRKLSDVPPGNVSPSRIVQVPAQGSGGNVHGFQKEASGNFNKLEYSFQRYQSAGPVKLLFTLNGQITRDPLVAVQQMGLGGPYSVRAYPSSVYLADNGLFASLEVMKTTYHHRLTTSLFYDFGKGHNLDVLANERRRSLLLHGIGVGLRFDYKVVVNMSLAWALDGKRNIPITGDGNGHFGNGSEALHRPTIYISVSGKIGH